MNAITRRINNYKISLILLLMSLFISFIKSNTCPAGTYLSNTSVNCLLCPPGTQKINDNLCEKCPIGYYSLGLGTCYLCPKGYISEEGSSRCTICQAGTYEVKNKECKQCNTSCKTCYNNDICTSCFDGFYLKQITFECQKCGEHCKTCEKGEETNNENCLSCDVNSEYKYLIDANGFGKNCVKECPSGTILKESKCISKPSEKKSSNLVAIIVPSIIVPIIIIVVIIVLYRRHKKRSNLQVDPLIGKDKMELSKNFELE